MWKTLSQILPRKLKTTTETENLSATNFNKFFTTIAGSLCRHFSHTPIPRVFTPRVDRDFTLRDVSPTLVKQELCKLKSSKATSLDGIPARVLKDAAPEIAKPIAYLKNLSSLTGIIPQAKVTPIFKSGEKDDVNNYRPISVLPLISKIMERTVQVQLVSSLTTNNVLSEHQSGFRKQHSTQTAITYLTDFILERMDKQEMPGAVFIDLKKAFDLVDHKCLLHKLEHYGVRGSSYNWFLDYLCTRSQRVKFGKELSSSLPLDYGVPQGSLLGPLLFVLYINDLPQCLLRSNISMYADDTVIYTNGSESDCIMTEIQEDLQRVEQWMKNSKLVLNLTKTKCMLFGTKQKLANASFKTQLRGSDIERVRNFCYRGVTLDECLSWKEHVSKVFTKVNKRLCLLGRI